MVVRRAGTMRPPPPPLPLTQPVQTDPIDEDEEDEQGDVPPTPITAIPASSKSRPRGARGERDVKSIRQSYSCAECRRLKLKCSRVWPCTSCEKRGCAQICPNGEMKTGKGKRLILANTEELHHRISLLEVALSQSHAKNTSNPHPLLAHPYLFTPRDPSNITPSNAASSSIPYPSPSQLKLTPDEEDDITEGAFGTLTIGVEGEAKFVGSFAGSEYLRDDVEKEREVDGDGDGLASVDGERLQTPVLGMRTPPDTAGLDGWRGMGPRNGVDLIGGKGLTGDVEALRRSLPTWETEGKVLVESYWENVNWMYQILPRPMFDNDHLVNAYDLETPANAHKVACVFLIMAIGVIFDLHRPPYDRRGDELFARGRACLNAVGLEHASPATVQALHLCGTYLMNHKHGDETEKFWPILGSAVKVAQRLGLHRDGTAFGLSTYEIEERRQVWWEVVTYDRLQALCFGRPCSTSNRASDTKFPEADERLIADKDGYHAAKYRLISMMERVIDVQTQVAPVSYLAVQALDKEFQKFKSTLPETLLPQTPIQSLPLDRSLHPHLVIHRLGIRLLIAQTRLHLNRPSFIRALYANSVDPSHGKMGPSFVALYESAQEIVQLVKQLVIYHPSLIARWWFFWFHALSSAVCLSAIAIHASTCAFAGPAFSGMSIVCDIAAAARAGCRAKNGLPMLLRLRKRALDALTIATRTKIPTNGSSAQPNIAKENGLDDDLSHLSGAAPKLRRVGSSPPDKKVVLSMNVGVGSPPRNTVLEGGNGNGGDNPSPNSIKSVATSDTLAEAAHYDQFGRLVDMSGSGPGLGLGSGVGMRMNTGLGIVAPPPPVMIGNGNGIGTGTGIGLVSPALSGGFALSGSVDTSLQRNQQSWSNEGGILGGIPQFTPGSPGLYDNTWPGMRPDQWDMGLVQGEGGNAQDHIYGLTMDGYGMDVDFEMGMGGMGYTDMGGEDGLRGFDIDAFVNGLGAGDLGLGNRM